MADEDKLLPSLIQYVRLEAFATEPKLWMYAISLQLYANGRPCFIRVYIGNGILTSFGPWSRESLIVNPKKFKNVEIQQMQTIPNSKQHFNDNAKLELDRTLACSYLQI